MKQNKIKSIFNNKKKYKLMSKRFLIYKFRNNDSIIGQNMFINDNKILINYIDRKKSNNNTIKIVISANNQDYFFNFGEEFIQNNIKRCNIVIDNSKNNINQLYNYKKNLTKLKLFLLDDLINMTDMFKYCSSLVSLPDISKLNTKYVKDMSDMLYGCISLTFLDDISKWDTSNVIYFDNVFSGCSSLLSIPDISKWNIKSGKSISGLFCRCSKLSNIPNISQWHIDNIENIAGIFNGCESLINIPDISQWNTSKINYMAGIFKDCIKITSLPDISNWNTINVTSISSLFYNCSSLL